MNETDRVKRRYGLTMEMYRLHKGNLKTERGILADIVFWRKELRHTQAQIDAIEECRAGLLRQRRALVAKLRAVGVQKSAMKADIGRSFMVVTQDLEAAAREAGGPDADL